MLNFVASEPRVKGGPPRPMLEAELGRPMSRSSARIQKRQRDGAGAEGREEQEPPLP